MHFSWARGAWNWFSNHLSNFPPDAEQWHYNIVRGFFNGHTTLSDNVRQNGTVEIRAPAHRGGTDPNEAEHITAAIYDPSTNEPCAVPVYIPANGRYEYRKTVHIYTGR
ncbi:hypothetical protein GALMADRAFT_138590 [Galerina marginata CBS 339.88]|uniref:Uncharacterized protein n=1 Tax=Galerina marginata (strain CBS 339.88) TaxID=685588 RepID=A0A067TEV6_GALM3|nr:hypothetical protein GALMADRAFT_138590 [Galerina marginata CBS 339.88]